MKTVLGWVVNWGEVGAGLPVREPNVTVDLFFSSREKFEELWDCVDKTKEQLLPFNVPDDFNKLDYIPDNY